MCCSVGMCRVMSCDLGKSPSQPADVASDDDAMLGEDATYLIHELRPASQCDG